MYILDCEDGYYTGIVYARMDQIDDKFRGHRQGGAANWTKRNKPKARSSCTPSTTRCTSSRPTPLRLGGTLRGDGVWGGDGGKGICGKRDGVNFLACFPRSGGRLPPRPQYLGPSSPPRGSNVSRVAPAGDRTVSLPLSFHNVTLCHARVTLASRPIFYSDTLCHSLLLVLKERRDF